MGGSEGVRLSLSVLLCYPGPSQTVLPRELRTFSISSFFSSTDNQKPIQLGVLRDGASKTLSLTPRSGWGGRGLIGTHIVPI